MGMILGASLGFDQIAREKDEGSLKFLVSAAPFTVTQSSTGRLFGRSLHWPLQWALRSF